MIGVDDLKWWGLELSKILTIRKAFFLLHMVVFSRIRLGFIFARWRSETLLLPQNKMAAFLPDFYKLEEGGVQKNLGLGGVNNRQQYNTENFFRHLLTPTYLR